MQVQISGKDIDLGEALQEYVQEKLQDGVHKYYGRPGEAKVTISKEGFGFRCDCVVHLSSGIVLMAQGEAGEIYSAFDDALAKLEKRVRRYKRRLKNHHADKDELPADSATSYVIAAPDDEDEGDDSDSIPFELQPAIIAETREDVREMTVSMAVMQLDLADKPVLVFKNAAHGSLNVVYRRKDGNFGWIDPSSS